jgi:hypothetical protein
VYFHFGHMKEKFLIKHLEIPLKTMGQAGCGGT